jgi:hypothetical protein
MVSINLWELWIQQLWWTPDIPLRTVYSLSPRASAEFETSSATAVRECNFQNAFTVFHA